MSNQFNPRDVTWLAFNERVLQEAMDETPDTVIVLAFWKDRSQFKIKTSAVSDRLMLIGALEEAKNKVITDGYAS